MIKKDRKDIIVAALVDAIIRERIGTDQATPDVINSTTSFVLTQHSNLPGFLQIPMRTIALLFGMSTLLMTGRRFDRLPYHRQSRHICSWRESAFGFRRDFIKFHETMTMFACYSELHDGANHGKSAFEHSEAAD